MARDVLDRTVGGWQEARPDIDMTPLQITGRLSRIGPHLARRQEAVFERFGLNRGEVGALSTLRVVGPPHRLSPGRLGKGLMLSSAGVTSRIDRLERRGLVRRLPDPDDRRGVIIELTDLGIETVDGAVKDGGSFPVGGPTTLIRAIAMAKGTTEDANARRVAVFRTIGGASCAGNRGFR